MRVHVVDAVVFRCSEGDAVVFRSSEGEHLKYFRMVLNQLCKAWLHLKLTSKVPVWSGGGQTSRLYGECGQNGKQFRKGGSKCHTKHTQNSEGSPLLSWNERVLLIMPKLMKHK